MYDRLSSSMNLGYQQNYHDYNRHRKVSINNVHQGVEKAIADVPIEPGGSIIQHYAVRDSTAMTSHPKMKQPEPLAFTRAELAALYKKALEKGSAISVASLMHALNAAGGNGNTPSEAGHPQLPVKPMYNYYFFPLKSFASELQRDHHQAACSEANLLFPFKRLSDFLCAGDSHFGGGVPIVGVFFPNLGCNLTREVSMNSVIGVSRRHLGVEWPSPIAALAISGGTQLDTAQLDTSHSQCLRLQSS
ncbi:hypothetical protein ALC57_04032 [Trachymyrmex cornetzi]|uniref:Uncharacterized protein n=1 Tax=Trachymyrmex cornetzi TaxID=471704 RepID=A0A151JF25_9HYME|nr:hypothetical protein ALC57_04032 [Trachymyrmex cornetzi]